MSVTSAESSQEYFGRRSLGPRLSRDLSNPSLTGWLKHCQLRKKQLLNRPFVQEENLDDQVNDNGLHHNRVKHAMRVKNGGKFMLNPEGPFRKVWDSASLALIVLELMTVPVWIAYYNSATVCTVFQPRAGGIQDPDQPAAQLKTFFAVSEIITRWFFWCDVVLNLFTGIKDEELGIVEYDPIIVGRMYASSWLLPDLVANFPLQCVFLAIDDQVNWYNFGFATRLVRVLSIRRRSHGNLLSWVDWITERYGRFNHASRMLAAVTLLTFVVLHVFACFAWLITRVQDFPDNPITSIIVWPQMLEIVTPVDVAVQYLWSFMCAVSTAIQNTWGPFPPITWPEALFWEFGMLATTVAWVLFNATVAVVFLGPQNPEYQYKAFMDESREVLAGLGLDEGHVSRVMDHLQCKYRGTRHNVMLVREELPYHLLGDVALAMFGPYLEVFPPFQSDQMVLEFVCTRVRRVTFEEDDVIIAKKFPLEYMYIIKDGLVGIKYKGDYSCWARSAHDTPQHLSAYCKASPSFTSLNQSSQSLSSAANNENLDPSSEVSVTRGSRIASSMTAAALQVAGRLRSSAEATLAQVLKLSRATKAGFIHSGDYHGDADRIDEETAAARMKGLVEVLGPPHYFGEAALLGPPPRTAAGMPLDESESTGLPTYSFHASPFTAVALTDCELLLIKYQDLIPLMKAVPQFKAMIQSQAVRYWEALHEWVDPREDVGDELWDSLKMEQVKTEELIAESSSKTVSSSVPSAIASRLSLGSGSSSTSFSHTIRAGFSSITAPIASIFDVKR